MAARRQKKLICGIEEVNVVAYGRLPSSPLNIYYIYVDLPPTVQ